MNEAVLDALRDNINTPQALAILQTLEGEELRAVPNIEPREGGDREELLADRVAGVVGAAHAGWKGAVGGVTDATIAAMEALGAERGRIVAAIGPCIAQASYEVDAGFRERFVATGADNARHFAGGRQGHYQFDLEGYVAARLRSAGIAAVEPMQLDTYAAEDRFYSFRRATHRSEPDYGRQISLIGLPPR